MKSLPRIPSFLLCLTLTVSDTVAGPDPVPAHASVSSAIDHYIDVRLAAEGVAPVAQASDHTLLRRTTLDLAGRIPTPAEQHWYFAQPEVERREALVERLMQLPDRAFHQRNFLDELLLYNKPYDDEFRRYLLWAAQQNRSWALMFSDMLLAQYEDGPQKGAAEYLRSRIREVEDLTNDTAVLFFGVNISCAKCHDHPLVDDWKQDHFYGMQSFFSRTYQTKKNTIAEQLFDEVKFTTTSGEDRKASFMFLTNEVVPDETPEYSDAERKVLEAKVRDARQKEDSEIPVPEFSPRRRLVDVALNDDRSLYFARNIVNRMWVRLLGTGLVDPPDQMHSENPSSHPELLDWLARDLRQHGYDLARLTRGIVLSAAYARSGEWRSQDEAPGPHLFAVARTRPLTPRQLAMSLLVAGRNPESWPAADAADEWSKLREDLEGQANGWAREFEQPGENFQIAVDEALFFSNNARINDDFLRDSGDRLVGYLNKVDTAERLTDTLWNIVVSRAPTDAEQTAAAEWLDRGDDRVANIRQLVWALVAGPEFRFNH